MVCMYCTGTTQVVNSRHQKQQNAVWRRRRCISCNAVFTTHEAPYYPASLALQMPDGTLRPFKKERLFLSILHSCQHRPTALDDAIALTDTTTKQLLATIAFGKTEAATLVKLTHNILQNFDHAAAVQYAAYHANYNA